MGLNYLQGKFDPHKVFRFAAVLLAAGTFSLSVSAQTMPLTFNCVTAAASAAPICEKIAEMVTSSGWPEKHPGISIGVEVRNNSATQLRVVLHLSTPDGRSAAIDRALSVSDTGITTALQDSFLQKLLLALPSDF